MSEINILDKTFTLMLDSQTISDRIDILADELNSVYKNKNPVFICVLKGSFMFMSDLLKKIKFNCSVNFIQISSYQDTKTTGTIKEVLGLTENISDKDIIIIEDIVDTGNTYNYLQGLIKKK
jgi:hypoxanthine phosphoribosyltransferase